MTRRVPRFRLLPVLAALFALFSQVALASGAGLDERAAELAAFDAARILCVGDQPADGPRPHPHRAADMPLSPPTVAVTLPALVSDELAVVPPRPLPVAVRRVDALPPGRGPPPETGRVGRPRAPPITA